MKVKRFSTARDKELKCTDPESYIDENGILYPRLAKMPIQDLSLIANFRVEMMKRYYTGDIREVDYPIVELLMDGLSASQVAPPDYPSGWPSENYRSSR